MKKVLASDHSQEVGPYSAIVQAGNFVFISGQVAEGEGSVGDQTRRIMENIRHLLERNGMCMEDIVKTTVHLRKREVFDEMNRSYQEFFSVYPARITVYGVELYGTCDVEIDAIAYREEGR